MLIFREEENVESSAINRIAVPTMACRIQRSSQKRQVERPQEPEVVEVYSEAVFSRNCTHAFAAAACTNAQTRTAKDESS